MSPCSEHRGLVGNAREDCRLDLGKNSGESREGAPVKELRNMVGHGSKLTLFTMPAPTIPLRWNAY